MIVDKRETDMGKNMISALQFARAYHGWHTYSWTDVATRSAIRRLVERGLVVVNGFQQFSAVNG